MRLSWILVGGVLCACLGCSPRTDAGFGFLDGKPVHIVREADKEKCLAAAKERCGGNFELLEEGPFSRHSDGWVNPERQKAQNGHYVRVKCENY